MQIKNTKNYDKNIQMIMLVYGMGGVGKTTFASTFPKPLLLDFENGAKYFGERGIEVDVAVFSKWLTTDDKKELAKAIKDYETIIVDPVGEAMEKLIQSETISGRQYRQASGDLTISGWGAVKKEMRNFLKWLKDTGKHVVIVAHVDEVSDDQKIIRRPMLATKLRDELVNMVDVAGYMHILKVGDEEKRVISVDSSDETIVKKDRTEKLGKYIKPDFEYIADLLGYNKKDEKKDDEKVAEKKDDKKEK